MIEVAINKGEMMKGFRWCILILLLVFSAKAEESVLGTVDGTPYRIGRWDTKWGNHRALVRVDQKAFAVQVHLAWRRRSNEVATFEVAVVDSNGKVVADRMLKNVSREAADLIFKPTAGAGDYAVYYRIPDPSKTEGFGPKSFPQTYYKQYQETAAKEWLAHVQTWKKLPKAKVVAFEALEKFGPEKLKAFNSFYPMEVIATEAEVKKLHFDHAGWSFLLFPEDRFHSIRMMKDLPYRWTKKKSNAPLEIKAAQGEYLTFQIGVWAWENLSDLKITFPDLIGPASRIKEDRFTCFNLGGTDWAGRTFTKKLSVPGGTIQSLWCGIDLPENLPLGRYEGQVLVKAGEGQAFKLIVQVENRKIAHRGDDDPWNMTRLRWLNSTIGIDDEPIAPYTPIRIGKNNTFNILGRTVQLGKSGLPAQATSHISMDKITKQGREILAAPVELQVLTASGKAAFAMNKIRLTKKAAGKVAFQTQGKSGNLKLRCRGTLESDGYMRYHLELTSLKSTDLSDVVLRIPFNSDVAKYAMGKFGASGVMPKPKTVPISGGMMYNVVWGGDYNAGLGCWLKNEQDEWNADNASKTKTPTLKTWTSGQKGHYELVKDSKATTYEIHLGQRTLAAGETLPLDFALVITPFKPLTQARWKQRIYHPSYGSMPSDKKAEPANLIDLHHATILNPYINYPFIANKLLKDKIDAFHAKDKQVRIYYTVRELSVMAPELWMLRSLGDEVYIDAPGYLGSLKVPHKQLESFGKSRFLRSGYPWFCEHLINHYRVRWHSYIRDNSNPTLRKQIGGEVDASIAVQGLSRWHNYYLEGLKWLIQNIGIDGLYLDGIGYDREIMKRVRKTMVEAGNPCTIDFHGAVHNAWITQAPFIDSIWYGEGARYQAGSDYWLVEVSGIPFGLSGGILSGDGRKEANHFRGMLYGFGRRIGWHGSYLAVPLWEFMDHFEIQKSEQLGYWDPACPVQSPNEKVKVSVYRKPHESLLVVASWDKNPVKVKLQIDWKALGIDPQHAKFSLPKVDRHQKAGKINLHKPITVPGGSGLFIVIHD